MTDQPDFSNITSPRIELDTDINQQIESEPLLNPIQKEQQSFDEPIPQKPAKKDKKLTILFGLLGFLAILTILSTIISVIARSKLPTPEPTQNIQNTDEKPVVTSVDISDSWKQKLAPAKSTLKILQETQNQNEFLPPTLDIKVGM